MTREELIERATAALRSDRRIRAAWLAGSLGRGGGDAWSDVDLVVAVEEADLPGFSAEVEALLGSIAETVLLRRLGLAPLWSAITPDWLRLDLLVLRPEDLPYREAGEHAPLFDPTGLTARFAQQRLEAPAGDRLLRLVEEFLRVLGLLVVVAGREEWIVGVSGAGHLRGHLIQLLLEERGEAGGGALCLEPKLDAEQRALLRELPAVEPTRESVLGAHRAIARAFLPRARRLAAELACQWPEPLERAARAALRRQLGMEL